VDQLFKILKAIGSNDTLSFELKKEKPDVLFITGVNPSQEERKCYQLRLLDLQQEEVEVPNVEFSCVFTMDSQAFQRSCRDIAVIDAEEVLIKSTGDALIMSGNGEGGICELEKKQSTEDTHGILFEQVNRTPLQNKYSLRFLMYFTKATNLTKDVKIHLKADYPVIIDYNVESLGLLRFCLAPKIDEEMEEQNRKAREAMEVDEEEEEYESEEEEEEYESEEEEEEEEEIVPPSTKRRRKI
jgi:proliferating cell nuclear antigen